MKRTIGTALAAASLLTLAACSQPAQEAPTEEAEAASAEGIEGKWKSDIASTQIERKPDVFLIKDGQYVCSSCNPPLTTPADGKFHAVADRPYYDSMAVTVVDDRTVKFERRKGDRDVGNSTWQVSADGNTLNVDFVDKTAATPVTGKATSTRVAAAPAGAHAASGTWKANPVSSMSDEGLTFSYDVDGDTIRNTAGDGTGYEAKIGGPDVPIQGDISGLVVAVTRPSENTFVETYKRDGKVVGVATMTIGADGKLSGVYENKMQGSTMRYTATKQ
ncbi:MAG TPA: hypothetical protein VFS49_02615 [Croceibacterium sp.]|nr:hypothetical protein [Croceibacterium sp.]